MTSFGPCEAWAVTWPICKELDLASPAATGRAVMAATQILWPLTGSRFGECPVKLRPCRRECHGAPWPGGWTEWPGGIGWPHPMLSGGLWFNMACGRCVGSCSCTALSEVLLPSVVSSITEVKVDGVVLPTSGYRVDDNRLLVRLGGLWPYCNDLAKDDVDVGTWSVTAKFGEPVPELGKMAAGEVACEVLKAMSGVDCRLPARVTQLARQGVTISMPDPSDVFKNGLTGLYLSDLFIQSVNPSHLKSPSMVYRVDEAPHRRVGT